MASTKSANGNGAYQAKEPEGVAFFDDGREVALLHFIYGKPNIDEIRGSPQKVIAAIDEYGRTTKYLMNVGPSKGKIVTDLIAEVKPETMVECGGYVGYSAILFADAVRKAGGKRYLSLERSPEFGAVIMALADLAGLGDIIKVVIGASDQSLARLHSTGALTHIDLLFMDHYKPAYKSDLKLAEHLKLIKPGSVIAADNVITPGNPPYLKYVRSSVEEKRQEAKDFKNVGYDFTGIPDRTRKQYENRLKQDNGVAELRVAGNPNLIYESKLLEGFEPTGEPDGVEVTRVVGEES